MNWCEGSAGFDTRRVCARVLAVAKIRRTSKERQNASNNESMKPTTREFKVGFAACGGFLAKTRRRTMLAANLSSQLPVRRDAGGQAELGTKVGNRLKWGREGKRRPSGAWNQCCKTYFTALSGWKVGKYTGYYRIGAHSSRIFSHKPTQVVDFPHLAMVGLFWGRPEIGFCHGQAELGTNWRDRIHREEREAQNLEMKRLKKKSTAMGREKIGNKIIETGIITGIRATRRIEAHEPT